jgi:hypothetical protein
MKSFWIEAEPMCFGVVLSKEMSRGVFKALLFFTYMCLLDVLQI